jgi:hypothetical protein
MAPHMVVVVSTFGGSMHGCQRPHGPTLEQESIRVALEVV